MRGFLLALLISAGLIFVASRLGLVDFHSQIHPSGLAEDTAAAPEIDVPSTDVGDAPPPIALNPSPALREIPVTGPEDPATRPEIRVKDRDER